MNSQKSLKLVGKIKDAQGLKGEIFAIIFSKETSWKSKIKEIFLSETEEVSKAQQFEVTQTRAHKDGLVLKLKGIEDRNQSESLKGRFLFISSEFFTSKKGETIYLNEIEGFVVFDGENKMGQIVGFSSNGAQDLLVVLYNEKKFEVPFVEAFLVNIDFTEKQVHMKLPPGLFE